MASRRLEDIPTSFRATYDHDPTASQGVEFRRTVEMDAAGSDGNGGGEVSAATLAAREDAVGRKIARDYQFRMWRKRPGSTLGDGESAALDAFHYYVSEQARAGADLYTIEGIPWWEGYDLECGDIVSATPPWASSALKLRVLEVTKSFRTELVSVRAIVVPCWRGTSPSRRRDCLPPLRRAAC